MNQKVRRITETAAMLALLICLQWVGSLIPDRIVKQLITGTCVNCVLAVTVLLVGMGSGITVALISPVFAFLLGIADQLITVLPIMLGNTCFVVLLRLLGGNRGKPVWRAPAALAAAAIAKFGVLYALVVEVICGVASGALLNKKLGQIDLLMQPMLTALPMAFGWKQLVTALLGGGLALLILPSLRRAVKK